MLLIMFIEALLTVAEPRPRAWRSRSNKKPVSKASRAKSASPSPPSSLVKKRPSRRGASTSRVPQLPEGWHARLREQSHNLARALELLEQAMAMMSEPKPSSLTRAESLRGAGLLTLLAASELLVVAGWFEADHAVAAGTLQR
ncbi:MAG TPA: hypothetical protein VHM25_22910 [Polyangiaceae bacterium]|jgi:hypothetical protein|nr:hypothetical protein [Polyangiaceae bacterium]